jgi:hypothetical protein
MKKNRDNISLWKRKKVYTIEIDQADLDAAILQRSHDYQDFVVENNPLLSNDSVLRIVSRQLGYDVD